MAISIDPLRPDYTAVQDQAEKLADRLRACPEGLSFNDAAQIAALFATTGGAGKN